MSCIGSCGSSSISSYYLSQLTNSTNTSSTSSSQTTTSDSEDDQIEISEFGQQLMSMMGGMGGMKGADGMQRPQGAPPDGAPGEKLSQEIEEKQTSFDESLNSKLEAAGVDTDQDIQLGYDDEGNIIVTSDVSADDKAIIESILAEDADLAASYQELTDMKAMAAEMEERSAQGPSQGQPPQGPPPDRDGGQGMSMGSPKMSSIASAYAANSTLASNATGATALMQQWGQMLGT